MVNVVFISRARGWLSFCLTRTDWDKMIHFEGLVHRRLRRRKLAVVFTDNVIDYAESRWQMVSFR